MGNSNGVTLNKGSFRVAFTGPECSGKTTLSLWCAKTFHLPWIPEQARSYLTGKTEYQREDLWRIGALQFHENQAQSPCICDTELTVVRLWEEEKFGQISSTIHELSLQESYTILFLCAPDIPWIYDPLRENPHDRERLYVRYKEDLDKRGISYVELKGVLEDRKKTIEKHFHKHHIFVPQ